MIDGTQYMEGSAMPDTTVMRETVLVTHTDNSGIPDYTINLTFAYHQESE